MRKIPAGTRRRPRERLAYHSPLRPRLQSALRSFILFCLLATPDERKLRISHVLCTAAYRCA